MGERRATNHPWAAGTALKRVVAINGVPLPIMRKICETDFRRALAVVVRWLGRRVNILRGKV